MGVFAVLITTIGIAYFIKTVSEKEEVKRKLSFKPYYDKEFEMIDC
jgi:hypothetical protein